LQRVQRDGRINNAFRIAPRFFRGQEIPMKRLVFSPLLLGLAFAAVAQTPAPAPVETTAPQASTVPASDAAQPASKDEVARKDDVTKAEVAKDDVAKDDVSDRSCLKETGSRLAPRPDSKGRKCINATGRAYTKGDLDSTGAIDLNDALRRLDPAVH
jgi:hypothetical protein